MRYGGCVTIVDNEGNIVFERELNEDEIVETLLAAIPDGEQAAEEEEPAEEAEPTVPESAPPSDGRKARKCGFCGGTGHQARTCSQKRVNDREPEEADEVEDEADASEEPEEPQRELTEAEYRHVRKLHTVEDKNSLQISLQLGLPIRQVNYAMLSASYDTYLRNARRD